MNPIDNERFGISYTREAQSQGASTVGDKTDSAALIKKTGTNQLKDLLAVVKNSIEPGIDLDRLNQLKAAINSDSYVLDVDALVHNILVSDYEL